MARDGLLYWAAQDDGTAYKGASVEQTVIVDFSDNTDDTWFNKLGISGTGAVAKDTFWKSDGLTYTVGSNVKYQAKNNNFGLDIKLNGLTITGLGSTISSITVVYTTGNTGRTLKLVSKDGTILKESTASESGNKASVSATSLSLTDGTLILSGSSVSANTSGQEVYIHSITMSYY